MTAADKTPALSASTYKNIPSVHFLSFLNGEACDLNRCGKI